MKPRFRAFTRELDWANFGEPLGLPWVEDTRGVVLYHPTKGVMGSIFFNHWTMSSAQVHVVLYTRMALRYGLIEEAWDYVFNGTGRIKLVGMVTASNTLSYRLAKHVGFRHSYSIPDGFKLGDALHVMELDRREAEHWPERFRLVLNEEQGHEQRV